MSGMVYMWLRWQCGYHCDRPEQVPAQLDDDFHTWLYDFIGW